MHAHLDTLICLPCDPQMFDAIPHRSGVLEIFWRDLLNTLLHRCIDAQWNTKGQRCEYHQFVSSISTVDIKSGIRLCVTQRLCLREHIVEGASLGAHFGQDKVARAIDDAGHLGHHVGNHRFAQCLDDRYATCHGSLESQLHAR